MTKVPPNQTSLVSAGTLGEGFFRTLPPWTAVLDLSEGSIGLKIYDKYCELKHYHLPGNHDQESHGNWADSDMPGGAGDSRPPAFSRPDYTGYAEWDESEHPRGKTTEESTPGSFAPKNGGRTGEPAIKMALEKVGVIAEKVKFENLTITESDDDDEDRFYVPDSWDMVPEDQQEATEKEWYSSNEDSFVQSEIENYWEDMVYEDARREIFSGQHTDLGLEIIKDVLENHGVDLEGSGFVDEGGDLKKELLGDLWENGDESSWQHTGWHSQWREEFGSQGGSYELKDNSLVINTELLANAVDENGDPLFYVPDPNQLGLSGVPQPGSDITSIAQDIFHDIEHGIVEEISDPQKHLIEESPDWITDNVGETMSEYWDQMSDSEKFQLAKDKFEDEWEQEAGESVEIEIREPATYKPLKDGKDYEDTKNFSAVLVDRRYREILAERDIRVGSHDERIDQLVWQNWKQESKSNIGYAFQAAVAAELGGKFYVSRTEREHLKAIEDANEYFSGGYESLKAFVRAQWEVNQFLMEKAGISEVDVYRSLWVHKSNLTDTQEVTVDDRERSYTALPKLFIHQSGAASTTLNRLIAHAASGQYIPADTERIVIRARVPRNSVLALPVFSKDADDEEVVIVGLNWKSWDVWRNRAPLFKDWDIHAKRNPDGTFDLTGKQQQYHQYVYRSKTDISGQYGSFVPKNAVVLDPMDNRLVQGHWLSGGVSKKAKIIDFIRERNDRNRKKEFHLPGEHDQERHGDWADEAGFYSPLNQAVLNARQTIAPARDWIAIITKAFGVTRDELTATGLIEYLQSRGNDQITKDELATFVRDHLVRIKPVVLAEKSQAYNEAEIRLNNSGYIVAKNVGQWVLLDRNNGRVVDPDKLSQQTLNDLNIIRAEIDRDKPRYDRPDYVLPGGENYREILLTLQQRELPKPEPITELSPLLEVVHDSNAPAHRQWFISSTLSAAAIPFGGRFATREEAIADAISIQNAAMLDEWERQNENPAFKSGHFDEPNIVAHLRMDDHVDTNGNKVLFLQEIQSDWAQIGRDKGFGPTEAQRQAAAAELKLVLAEKNRILNSNEFGNDAQLTALTERENALEAIASGKQDLPPSGPFVTDTKSWVGLAMKHAVQEAVNKGYDAVAWTTGEQQADRWSLNHALESIHWSSTWLAGGTGGFEIGVPERTYITFKGVRDVGDIELSVDPAGRITSTETTARAARDWIGKPLSDVVGKEIAVKILGSEKGELGGLDLKVGGEGMKSFYDQIVPSVTNRLVKKSDPAANIEKIRVVFRELDRYGRVDPNKSYDREQLGFYLTKKMRDMIRKGIALFTSDEEPRVYHLPGEHDQESHGNWAEGNGVRARDIFTNGDSIHEWGYDPQPQKFDAYQPDEDDPGVMVAVMVPKDTVEKLAIEGGNTPDQLHCTLAYLGKLSVVRDKLPAIRQTLSDVAANHMRMTGKINGLGRFGASESSEGKEVVYATLDCPGLSLLRNDIVNALEFIGVEIAKDHDFAPHITLSYVEPGEEKDVPLPDYEMPVGEVVLAWGDEHEGFKLGVLRNARGYHLPGEHDQEAHGNWAEGADSPDYGNKPIFDVERRIKTEKVEHAHLFFPARSTSQPAEWNGEAISDQGNRVGIPRSLVERAREMGGKAILTHNHPEPTAFSLGDMYAAWLMNLGEIRAVTKYWGNDYTFILKPPLGGWPNFTKIQEAFSDAQAFIEPALAANAMVSRSISSTYDMQVLAASHAVNKAVAKKLGLNYKLIRIGPRTRKSGPD